MHVSKEKLLDAKSYTSIYDFFGPTPFNNVLYKNMRKHNKDLSVHIKCEDADKMNSQSYNNSMTLNSSRYITSEKYHLLNKDFSHKSIVRSTSTIFYDLDEVAKRHSFHCMNDISSSNVNLLKIMKIPLNTNGFNGKNDAIIQECATQIQAKLQPRDSIEINTKKIKKTFPEDSYLSSEIFLRDDSYFADSNNHYYEKEVPDRQQKFWSFAKYRTEYTNPIPEEKKRRKKDRGKRTEDPCPCQLFSYACPCTEKKSLTELAKNSKSLTVADQITSTIIFPVDDRNELKSNKSRKSKSQPTKEDKLLSTDYIEVVEKIQVLPTKTEAQVSAPIKHDVPTLTDIIHMDDTSNRSKAKQTKKRRKITCPKCRENVDVLLSTTDEEESMKYVNSSMYQIKENTSKTGYVSSKHNRQKSVIAEDNCGHEPQCELIPVCQILPTDNVYLTHKCIRQRSNQKTTTPKIIRITKACRHHPPCTVVPSCQRANVLKNNCEYVPPCLHRPRCVNIPLCVPLKNLHYEEHVKTVDDDCVTCRHVPKCKYVPECQYEPLRNNLDNHLHIVSQVQNACEVLSEFQQPQYVSNPKVPIIQNIVPSSQAFAPTQCKCCKSNKSCQFDCPDCRCGLGNTAKEVDSNEAVIFIRDVGCQFRHKRCPHKDSDQSKISSGSFDLDVKMGNYYTNVHTLRYEDKCTNPIVDKELSETSISITSLEIDSHCPTHGERSSRKRSVRTTGFIPKQNTCPYIAYTTQRSQVMPSQMYSGDNELNDARTLGHGYAYSSFPVKSHRSFLRGKYKKMFAVKRRRKSKVSSHGFGSHSKKQFYVQNFN